jgi:hypothetical protein
MAAPRTCSRQPRQMDAGVLGAEIGSFRLHLAAETRHPRRYAFTSRRWPGSPPPACSARSTRPSGSRRSGATCRSGCIAAREVQRCLCQQPVPGAATALQMAARQGRQARIVKISYDAARTMDRYLRARARHRQAWRPQLWLGVGGRGPPAASGIYQAVARRGWRCGVEVWPHWSLHPLQPHLARARRPERGPNGAQRLVLPADARPLGRKRPQRPRPPRLRPHHDRHSITRPPPSTAEPRPLGTTSASSRYARLPRRLRPSVRTCRTGSSALQSMH